MALLASYPYIASFLLGQLPKDGSQAVQWRPQLSNQYAFSFL